MLNTKVCESSQLLKYSLFQIETEREERKWLWWWWWMIKHAHVPGDGDGEGEKGEDEENVFKFNWILNVLNVNLFLCL